jgi:hypothetical protein
MAEQSQIFYKRMYPCVYITFNSLVADCPFSKSRAVNITVILLGSCASCLQTSNPMPLLAPVINAILFLSLLLSLSCLFINRHQSVYNIIMYYYIIKCIFRFAVFQVVYLQLKKGNSGQWITIILLVFKVKSKICLSNSVARYPNHMSWIVKIWHFG